MGVARLINCFEMPAGREEDFLAAFGQMNAHMAARPGFVGNWLHRSLTADARYRFVNYVEWESPAHLRAARDDRFDQLRAAVLAVGVTSDHALYEIVQQRQGGDRPADQVPGPLDGRPAHV